MWIAILIEFVAFWTIAKLCIEALDWDLGVSDYLDGTGLTRPYSGISDPVVHNLDKLTSETKPAVFFQNC